MLDMNYYTKQCLNQSEAETFLKFFKKTKFFTVKSLMYKLKHPEELTSWITSPKTKEDIIKLCSIFATNLDSIAPKYKDIKEYLMSQLDDTASTFPEFEWKKSNHGGTCPNCGSKELFTTNKNQNGGIKCNRENNCGYRSDVLQWLIDNNGLTPGAALEELAERVGVDLKEYQKSLEVHIDDGNNPSASNITKKPKIVKHNTNTIANEIAYENINTNINTYNLRELKANYQNLDDAKKFSLICTAIYMLSKKTNQTKKATYYKSRSISGIETPLLKEKVLQISKELGFLDKEDMPKLVDYLSKTFPLEDLIGFGVINDGTHKAPFSFKHYCEEGFIVIPNFDIYSNLVDGLKLRNIKLAKWQDKSMKEPELSYKRISNPYPYGLRLDSIKNKDTFRFFEGQVDLFSLPAKEGCCDIAIPGVNGINESQLGLLKGCNVELWFDQDDAGQKSANGALLIRLTNSKIDITDMASKSFVEELKRTNDKSVNIEVVENIATIKDLIFPKNEIGLERFRLFETIISRRNIQFVKRQTKGLKDKLIEAGVANVTVVQWDTTLGSDVNEVLQNKNIEKLIK